MQSPNGSPMIVYVPVGSGPLRNKIIAAGHGMISNVERFGVPDCRWVMDNGAWIYYKDGLPFNEKKFLKRLDQILRVQPCRRPEWCVVPDKVADPASLSFSTRWRQRLPSELRWYLAVQDGMTETGVEEALQAQKYAGLFVGGSDNFKNRTACEWVRFAHELGYPCHVARVNYKNRLRWCVEIKADSIDGTGWTRNSGWLKYLQNMPTRPPMLWDA